MTKVSYETDCFADIDDMEKTYYLGLQKNKYSKTSTIKKKLGITVSADLTIEELYNMLNDIYPEFNKIFGVLPLNKILLIKANNIPNFITYIECLKLSCTEEELDVVEELLYILFDYGKFQTKKLTPFFQEHFDFRVCHYCNRTYTTDYVKTKYTKTYQATFQLDHFYEKANYPYLALSLYNFIPCCSTCNSTVKNSEINSKDDDCYAKQCIAPNRDDFDFDERVRFTSFYNNEDARIENPTDIKRELIEYSGDDKYKNYIDLFKLNERYRSHENLTFDLIQTRDVMPDTRISEISDLLSITEDEVKMHFFGKYLYDDIANDTLSKYLKDLGRELGLI